jgi:hypothetical protein
MICKLLKNNKSRSARFGVPVGVGHTPPNPD